jgi:YaiO family outer membrane protein
MNRVAHRRAILATPAFLAALCWAQTPPDTPQDVQSQLPFRLELTGYGSHVSDPYGNWRGAQSALWIRSNQFFVPAFIFDSQTRPTGTQQDYGFFSYLNWTKSFYTVQSISVAPQSTPADVYFPKIRVDVKAHWKLPPSRNLVLGLGYTHFDLGIANGHGEIMNAGAIWYHRKLVIEGNLFVNRNQPGDLYSASGTVSAQYGREGKSWTGVTLGGGHQLYEYVGQTPFNVRRDGYTLEAFYRKWLSRHVGVIVAFDHQNLIGAYRLWGGKSGLFFEF